MRFPRSSGILLHPTSLPGEFGIGDLGPEAHRFAETLAETGQRWWQVLPLGPTGGMNSPYQSLSTFAGNPLLISPEAMVERGWLDRRDLKAGSSVPRDQVDFKAVKKVKNRLLRKAFGRFPADDPEFLTFLQTSRQWLDDYALFVALKEASDEEPWFRWAPALVSRKPEAMARARAKLAPSIRFHQFVQFVFETQMQSLRRRCAEREVQLIGDIPIFVAQDSADVWARPELFYLDKKGRPTIQAGVPPDLFSQSGQLWGNPLYRWEAHEAEGYAWWIERLSALLRWVDLIRIDHFRGLEAYWEVPGKARTAAGGRWVTGPGSAFFQALQRHYADLPFIAEDLGVITPPVEALRDEFDLPGMRVLQFGFATTPGEEKYLPHRFIRHCIVYTGTHDNDTSRGWLDSANVRTTQSRKEILAERAYALRYVGTTGKEFHWDMIRLAFSSVADVAIIPMQDVLGLGSEARMNVPGKAEGNWGWRCLAGQFTTAIQDRLADLTAVQSRWNGTIPQRFHPHRVREARPAQAAVALPRRRRSGTAGQVKPGKGTKD